MTLTIHSVTTNKFNLSPDVVIKYYVTLR